MKSVRFLNGYRVVYMPEHPRAMLSENWQGYVYEHIVEAEKSIGRRLRSCEVVHHLDSDRSNNMASNLLVIEKGQHIKLHNWLNPRGLCKNGFLKMKTCPVCGNVVQNNKNTCCSKECSDYMRYETIFKNGPSKEQLERDLSEMSYVKVGKKYGVSDNAIRKWARKYGLL